MILTITSNDRKMNAREKTKLGGLIVKAGLRYEKRVLLLGGLIDLRRRLQADAGERSRLMEIGAEAFGNARH
ncbi:conjugal transfer protein TraD [Ensifer canadensis]